MRKVAIVGSAGTTRMDAPYDDESWEIWTMNDMCFVCPRIDRMFDLHAVDVIQTDTPEEWNWLRVNKTVPVYMHFPDAVQVPMAVQYPSEVILKSFGRYFTNSVSWMLALALHEGVDELALYGCDMAVDGEYEYQRPSCEYLIGWARGEGIPVFIPDHSDLLKTPFQYGLESSPVTNILDARLDDLLAKRNLHRNQKAQAALDEAYIEGALEVIQYVRKVWGG